MTHRRDGFSLIEVIVAMTMFAVVTLGAGKLSAAVGVKGRTNDLTTKRNAVIQLEANKFGAMPFQTLVGWSTTPTTLTRDNFTYTRRLAITKQGQTRYTVTIVVTPTADPSKKDSVMIERSNPPVGSPLCVGC